LNNQRRSSRMSVLEIARFALNKGYIRLRIGVNVQTKRFLLADHPTFTEDFTKNLAGQCDRSGMGAVYRTHLNYLAFDQFDALVFKEANFSNFVILFARPAVRSRFRNYVSSRYRHNYLHECVPASHYMLIPQRLACLQHVPDALLRGFRTAQTDE